MSDDAEDYTEYRAPFEIDRDLMVERENRHQMYREEGHSWACHLLTDEGDECTCHLKGAQ